MNTHSRPHRIQAGFTLLEILIALAIVAIGLSAALRASGVGTEGVMEYRSHLLAQWLAENVATEYSARQAWPEPGERNTRAELAGHTFLLMERVKTTPNPRFRRMEIRVSSPDEPDRALRTLTLFLTKPN